jgi:hypothetical protein
MRLREGRRLAISIGTVIFVHVGCNNATAPTPLPPGYAGEWTGTTVQGTAVQFTVAADSVTSFILTYNFSADCSSTLTNRNLAVPIRKQDPPGPPPYDQPGFAFGTNEVTSGTAINGHFSPDRRSAAGQFVLVKYGACGDVVVGTWSARRR